MSLWNDEDVSERQWLVTRIDEDGWDYVLAGGGLQNGLIALALLHHHPTLRVLLLESEDGLCGNHTWSFHQSDVSAGAATWLSTVASVRWPGYEVRFPGMTRRVDCGYGSFSSRELDGALTAAFEQAPHAQILTGAHVDRLTGNAVMLSDGRRFLGRHVIDGRGPLRSSDEFGSGYQKFVGLELTLAQPGPRSEPLLMDATVPQEDGFRFMYVLPFSAHRVLIEDTCFSNHPTLNIRKGRERVRAYAEEKGYAVASEIRMESGVLPMPYRKAPHRPSSMPLTVGYRGGFFHPATGYSFPCALRVAQHIAHCAPESPLNPEWDRLVAHHRSQYRFATVLNRLLFTAYAPEGRHPIFSRFYRLPEPCIERFYRMDATMGDKARFFLGRPPRGFTLRQLLKGAAFP